MSISRKTYLGVISLSTRSSFMFDATGKKIFLDTAALKHLRNNEISQQKKVRARSTPEN